VFWAGAIGGLVLELVSGSWGVELPSYSRRRPAETRFAPLGPWHDLGFLGRMTTGAIAAPVFLILVNVIGDSTDSASLTALGDDLESLAWGALIGAASPAAWKLGEGLVTSRIGLAQQHLSDQLQSQAESDLETAKEQIADPNTSNQEAVATLALAQGRLESARTVLAGGDAAVE